MTERQILQKKIGTLKFAMVDMNLFLDTHPNDQEALKKLREFEEQLRPLETEYEKKFGPLQYSDNENNTWRWVKNPWPWDLEEDS